MSDYFVHESSYIDDNVTIGAGTKVWYFCHIQGGAVIGKNCSLGQNVNVAGNVKIGDGVKIQNNVSVYEGVELEDYVFCGPSMVFTNDLTPRSKYAKGRESYLKTLVREGASIGANATVVCGIEIGRWAMIGAGAVVTKDVADYALVLGVPVIPEGYYSSFAQYTIKLESRKQRDGLQGYLKEQGIPSAVYYQKPMHRQGAFADLNFDDSDFPVTIKLCDTVLSLPMHPYLSEADVERVCVEIKRYLK